MTAGSVRAPDEGDALTVADLGGRSVALWGFGREGRATLDALRALPRPPREVVIVTDRPPRAGTAAPPGTEWVAGGPGLARLLSAEVVVRSPGISRYRDDASRVAATTTVTTGTNLWFSEHSEERVVAVTGSKGKSTTSSLIAHLARAAGETVVLAGNIGVPLLARLHPEPAPGIWVLELSSHQTADLVRSPRIGVLTNLYREHLDWHGTLGRYIADKLSLFTHRSDGVAVLNREDPGTREWTQQLPGRRAWFSDPAGYHVDGGTIRWRGQPLLAASALRLRGRHNLVNACAALCAAEQAGIDARAHAGALRSFHPLRHRLEPVGEAGGVGYVNDSISTIPESTVAALEALRGREIVLIAGGFDRGQDHAPLLRALGRGTDVRAVVTLPPSGERLAAQLRDLGGAPPVVAARDLAEAVDLAQQRVRPGGVVLLSPAAPSYGAFRDFEERGDAFRALVSAITAGGAAGAPGSAPC